MFAKISKNKCRMFFPCAVCFIYVQVLCKVLCWYFDKLICNVKDFNHFDFWGNFLFNFRFHVQLIRKTYFWNRKANTLESALRTIKYISTIIKSSNNADANYNFFVKKLDYIYLQRNTENKSWILCDKNESWDRLVKFEIRFSQHTP